MVKYSGAAADPQKSVKARGSDLRVHFKVRFGPRAAHALRLRRVALRCRFTRRAAPGSLRGRDVAGCQLRAACGFASRGPVR
jgi:hypothetical protein